jgi:hypothetical protein
VDAAGATVLLQPAATSAMAAAVATAKTLARRILGIVLLG